MLLKEVHHRVKNNLQIISSLLSIQAASIEDASVSKALRENQERVQSMALIHDRLNANENPDQIDLREYVQTLTHDLFYSYGVDSALVRLRLELDSIWLPLTQATPCGLILNEILTNAFKYAFPDGQSGEILVGLHCVKDNRVQLTVSDNGVGLPTGLDPRKSQSMGLCIVEILGRQLEGTIKHETGADQRGTLFSLTFPRETDEARNARGGKQSVARKPASQATGGMEQIA